MLINNLAMTVSQVQKELALSETRRRNEGGSIVHATSPSAFLVTGLEIEETQYVFLMAIFLID